MLTPSIAYSRLAGWMDNIASKVKNWSKRWTKIFLTNSERNKFSENPWKKFSRQLLIAFCHRMTIFHLIILTFYPEYMARSVQFNETVLFASFVLFCFALSRFSVSCASYKTPGCIGIGKMACISRITNAYKPHCRLNTLLPFLLLKPNVRTQKHTYTRRILYFSFCVRCYNGALSVHCRVFLQLYVDCTDGFVSFFRFNLLHLRRQLYILLNSKWHRGDTT